MDRILERLIKYIRKEDVALFIGAGFSLKAGAPSVWDIIKAILEEGGKSFADTIPANDQNNLRLVSEAFIHDCNGRNDLMTLLRNLFAFEPKDTSDQQTLVRIPHIKKIFTTNYDTLIEDAYPKSKRNIVIANEGCAFTEDNVVTIYKVHGDITTLNDCSSIIISESDYKGYFKNKRFNFIWEELKNTFIKKHVVFVGYGLEDDNILDIIKTVRKSINNSMKGMFLISPSISEAKVRQLEKNDVAYIKATAEEVFNEILIGLKGNIVDDYRHKKVSQETYDAFLSMNGGLFTTTTHLEDQNKIENISVKDGVERKEKVNFGVAEDINNAIKQGIYNSKIILNGTHINIPALKIPAANLNNFSHTINGIRFANKEDISSLIVAPSIEHLSVTFKMPSIGFKETLNGYRHKEGNKILIDVETPICILTLSLSGVSKTMDVTIHYNETYTNSNDALKWIDFIVASFSGKTFTVNGISLNSNPDQCKDFADFEKIKLYYETIRRIEMEMDVDFELYENYSEDRLYYALCVYHYHINRGFRKELPKNATITFEIDSRDPHNVPVEKFDSEEFVMIQCTPLGNVELNKKKFNIPYCTTVFMDCKAERVTKIDDFNYTVTMKDKSPTCTVWCSDKQPEQEGNVLHLGKQEIVG